MEKEHDFASKRQHSNSFHWTRKVGSDENDDVSSLNHLHDKTKPLSKHNSASSSSSTPKRKLQSFAVSRLRSVIASLSRVRPGQNSGLGSRVVGTLFGSRRGHVHFSIQKDPTSPPAFLIELATPISGLVKEMASGLVRIALECDKSKEDKEGGGGNGSRRHGGGGGTRRLVEEPTWRTYCNGKKCGFATRRDCGEKEKKVLKALEMVSMGAGVLPETDETNGGGGVAGGGREGGERAGRGSRGGAGGGGGGAGGGGVGTGGGSEGGTGVGREGGAACGRGGAGGGGGETGVGSEGGATSGRCQAGGGGDRADGGGSGGGDIMYMRAKFERIVGSRDSEAFYMMNPDSNGAPELSIYLLRI